MNTTTNKTPIDIYNYPAGGFASQLDELRYRVAVMEAVEGGAKREYSRCDSAVWHHLLDYDHTWRWDTCRYRIARPRIATGHNPSGLTEDQVGVAEGWRLLSTEEVRADASRKNGVNGVSMWSLIGGRWYTEGLAMGNLLDCTYRTKQPAGFYLPQATKPLVAWTFETAPRGLVLLRNKRAHSTEWLVNTWRTEGIRCGYGYICFSDLMALYEHSLDNGKTWLPCGTEA